MIAELDILKVKAFIFLYVYMYRFISGAAH